MPLWKVIVIVVVSAVALFVLLLVYTLWPTIIDISENDSLKALIGKPLSIKTDAFIYVAEKGQYRFNENTLTQNSQYADLKKYNLPPGSVITIRKFKTYKSNAGAGFTDVFVLGEFTTTDGTKVEFEYAWGNIDPSLYSKEVPDLPIAPWQDNTEAPVHVEK